MYTILKINPQSSRLRKNLLTLGPLGKLPIGKILNTASEHKDTGSP